jgi:hypothetical protein
MTLKLQIINLIEKGYHNKQIAAALNASLRYVVTVRTDFNAASPVVYRSRIELPKAGTKSRELCEFIKANPSMSFNEIVAATGQDRGLIGSVKRRFFPENKQVSASR